MNILVTGGCGFIGSALCRHLVKDGRNTIVNLDALTYAADRHSLDQLSSCDNFKFHEGNILETERVIDILHKHEIGAIIHLAAESHVDNSITSPKVFLETNILGTYSLLTASEKYLADTGQREQFRFLHVSTDEVYGDLEKSGPAFEETSKYDPSSPYSASKAASDHLVSAWHRTYGTPAIITNCSNNYGPYQFPEKLIPLMITNAITNKPLPVYGTGENIRDWLHVEDHVAALETVLVSGKTGSTYNIGGNAEHSNLDIVKSICAILDDISPRSDGRSYADQIAFVADRAGHDFRYAINPAKIRKELAWQPRHAFDAGLRKTVRWYLDNEEWWQPLKDRIKTK